MKIKNYLIISLSIILLQSGLAEVNPKSISITLINNSPIERKDEVVKVHLNNLLDHYPDFNFNNIFVKEGEKEIVSEVIEDRADKIEILLIYINFLPNEIKKLTIETNTNAERIPKLTKAYLGKKSGYQKLDGYYTNGHFEEVDYVKVPQDHFPHNALYQFEGPGWESENVGYRLYLDERNRTDIFGKREPNLITSLIGKDDLVSDGKESYQKLQDWGMDIFKVGNSLGIGSAATFRNDSVYTISNSDSVFCKTYNNNLHSEVNTIHYGWNVEESKYDISTTYSITAGSRLTQADIRTNKEIENFCTGLAKHQGTDFFKSDNYEWNYIALWGKQTLVNDNLGIALFYNEDNLIKVSENELNHLVILKPKVNEITYYFAAAWEQEKNGIKSKKEFEDYLNSEIEKFNNPIKIYFE